MAALVEDDGIFFFFRGRRIASSCGPPLLFLFPRVSMKVVANGEIGE